MLRGLRESLASLLRRVDPDEDDDPFEAAAELRARTPADFKPVLPPPPPLAPIPLPDQQPAAGPPPLVGEPPVVSSEQPMPDDGELDVDPIMVELSGSMPPAAKPQTDRVPGTDRTTRRATVRRSVSPLVQELVNQNEEALAKPPPLRRSITEKIERADTTVMQPDEIAAQPPAAGTGTERRARPTTQRFSPDTDRVRREQQNEAAMSETERVRRGLRSTETARLRRDASGDTARVARDPNGDAAARQRPPSTVDTAAVKRDKGTRSDVIPFAAATGDVRPPTKVPAARDAWLTPLPRPIDPSADVEVPKDELADKNARHLYGEGQL